MVLAGRAAQTSAPKAQEVSLKASAVSKCFINGGFIPGERDSTPLSALQQKSWKYRAAKTHS